MVTSVQIRLFDFELVKISKLDLNLDLEILSSYLSWKLIETIIYQNDYYILGMINRKDTDFSFSLIILKN